MWSGNNKGIKNVCTNSLEEKEGNLGEKKEESVKELHRMTETTRREFFINSANFKAKKPPRPEPNKCTCGETM